MAGSECIANIDTMTASQKDAMYYIVGLAIELNGPDIDTFIQLMRDLLEDTK